MKNSKARQKIYKEQTERTNKNKKFQAEQEFQTQSSIYQCYQKVKTKQDAYKIKIDNLQKTFNTVLTTYAQQISQEKIKIERLMQKYGQQAEKHMENKIFWKNAINEVESTVEYFIYKLRDYHQSQNIKLRAFCQINLNSLSQLLRKEIQKRNILQQELNNNRQKLVTSKQEFKKWINLNLKSDKIIRQIQESIKGLCKNFKVKMQQTRIQKEKDFLQAKDYVEKLTKLLVNNIEEEKIERQLNKQQILQAFERLCIKTGLNLL